MVDETLYVLGGRTLSGVFSTSIECYDHEKNEWNKKASIPRTGEVFTKKRQNNYYFFKGCSLRVFNGVINNLKSIVLKR